MVKQPKSFSNFPALKPKLWSLDKIIPYHSNPRTHPVEQIALLAKLFLRHGIDQPIVVDEDGVILKGHGRRLAAYEAGLAEFPVVQRDDLSDIEKRALRLEDNQVALLSEWSVELLRSELSSLSLGGYDVKLLGFDDVQLVSFMSIPSGEDPEQTPDPPAEPISKPGDVWIMGKHRLLCGDSTKSDDVALVLNKHKPNLMVTDPPYGVEYDPAWRNRLVRANGTKVSAMAVGVVKNDDRADWTDSWKLFCGDVAYVWHGGMHSGTVQASLEDAGLEIRSQIIWAKQHAAIGRGDYHWRHEPCWYAVRKGRRGNWASDRKQTTVWDIDKPQKSETGHSTQKPIECMRRPIQNNSKPGDYIYEPFAGSGTTVIAAEMMNRYCLAIEISPVYVDVIVLRWQEFAKGTAILDGDGRTFAEIAAERARKSKSSGKKPDAPRAARARSRATSPD